MSGLCGDRIVLGRRKSATCEGRSHRRGAGRFKDLGDLSGEIELLRSLFVHLAEELDRSAAALRDGGPVPGPELEARLADCRSRFEALRLAVSAVEGGL